MAVTLVPVITLDGAILSTAVRDALVAVEVDRSFNLVGRATLRFLETGYQLVAATKFALGAKVEIATSDGPTIFAGEVTGISLDQDHQGPAVTELTVTVDDPSYKLGATTRTEAFLNRKYSDMISAMAGAAGLQASVDATSDVHPYLLQAGTDLAYLDWITTRCGMVWWVDDGTLHATKAGTSTTTVTVRLGVDLMRVSTRASGLHPGKVTVTGWDDAQQEPIQHVASDTRAPEADLVSTYPGRARADEGVTVSGTSPLTTAEAEQLSTAILAASTSAAVTTRGTTELNAAIKPGVSVKVEDAGPATGSYLVSRVRHTFDTTGFYTHFTAGPVRPEGLVDLLGRPPASSGGAIGDLMVGVVSNVQDPDGIGRVKVKLPTLGGSTDSEWARVVSLGGGKQRGVVFHPELNDEVLVGFEQGDTRRPVVIGGLFSKTNGLPDTDDVDAGQVNYRRITSRLGHVVELADGSSSDKQHILLKTAQGHRIRLGEDMLEIDVKQKPVSITNGQARIDFSDRGDISIEGNNITIKAKGSLKAEGSAGVDLKTDASANLQGATVSVKGQASTAVEGSGALTLKGGTVAIN